CALLERVAAPGILTMACVVMLATLATKLWSGKTCNIASAQHAADTPARDKRIDLCRPWQRTGRYCALFPFRVGGQKSRRDFSLGHAFGQCQRRSSDRCFRRVGSRQRIVICLVKSVAVRGDGIFGLLHHRLL